MSRRSAQALSRRVLAHVRSVQRDHLSDLRATVAFLLTLAQLNILSAPATWWRALASADHLRPATHRLTLPTPNLADADSSTALDNQSVVTTTYTARGTVQHVAGSYGTLVASVKRDADGLVSDIV